MKFLGWMHRKLTQNGTDPNMNSTIGNLAACFSEQNYYKEPTKTLTGFNINCQKPSSRSEHNNVDIDFCKESFDPFDFLAIGTFGMELLSTDPPTPTLPTSIEKLTNPSEITENDLNFISYELEKFIEAEEREIPNDTSGRSSQASIITLSHKPTEGADSEGHMYTMACPLQNYLFATSIEQTETGEEVKKENTSLERVNKMNIDQDDLVKICEGEEKKPRKMNVARFMKKAVKKFNSPSTCSKASSKDDDDALSISIKKKFSKAVKMFHRKVHPQEMTETQFAKLKKGKKDISHEDVRQIKGYNRNNMVGASGNMSEKSTGKLSSNGAYTAASKINGGHWIKTDSDFLVLEL